MTTESPTLKIVTSLPTLWPRSPDAHKGDFGRVLIIAGSRGMSGAAILCANAAARGGAGLVKIAAPTEVQPIVASACPVCTTTALPQDADGRLAAAALTTLGTLCQAHDVVAIGPGLDRSPDVTTIVVELVTKLARPMVIDADGLNAFIGRVDQLRGGSWPRIITPHPGEFARLLDVDIKSVQARRRELASDFARNHACIVVLKGRQTIVTDGHRVFENMTGNPGMATGGTGDVLTGLIAAFVGQGLGPFEATQLAVHMHGLAGDLARDQIGEVSLIATDLIDFLPAAIRAKNA